MRGQSVYFTRPGHVEVVTEEVPSPGPGEVLVRSLASAISAGTEMLFYRGQVHEKMRLDQNIHCLRGVAHYPFKFGYSIVGEVIGLGSDVSPDWSERLVFSFHPHQSHFCSSVEDLFIIPEGIRVEDALFIPSIETALSLAMDGEVTLGENIIVLGQGVIGLLTTSLLAMLPLGGLVTVDGLPLRRDFSRRFGALMSFDVDVSAEELLTMTGWPDKADLIYELSGNPLALQYAIDLTGFEGRMVVGSWYGVKGAQLQLGETFHRNRMRIISSQVSSIGSRFLSRWNKKRRMDFAWKMLREVRPSQLITHRINIAEAPRAFRLIDEASPEVIQVVLTYD